MTNEDKTAMREFLNGFLGVCGGIAIFLAIVYFSSGGGTETPSNERFKVVDRYDNRCDVIRYSPGNTATFKYFLDCK